MIRRRAEKQRRFCNVFLFVQFGDRRPGRFLASRIMNSESSTWRNIVLGVLGGFVGNLVFGLVGLTATGFIGDIIVSIVGACICIWLGRKMFG